MFSGHFYNEHTRRAVAVFGTLFNNLTVVKRDGSGNALQQIKVPLSYGPRQKFLARIRQEEQLNDPRLAIKLPRMSFEITGLEYDETTRLTRGTRLNVPGTSTTSRKTMFYPSTYRLSFELSIMAKHTDDALQILEQILPFFQPEYSVTVNEVDNNFQSDMPFVLTGVSLNDDYEGDFETRRSLIYTLTFDTRIKYYGGLSDSGAIIRETKTNISDPDMTTSGEPFSTQQTTITPTDANEDDNFTINVSFDARVPEQFELFFANVTSGPFTESESVIGTTSGATGVLLEERSDSILVGIPDDTFEVGETVTGQTSGANFTITDLNSIWNTL
jgi:hypothetical protein